MLWAGVHRSLRRSSRKDLPISILGWLGGRVGDFTPGLEMGQPHVCTTAPGNVSDDQVQATALKEWHHYSLDALRRIPISSLACFGGGTGALKLEIPEGSHRTEEGTFKTGTGPTCLQYYEFPQEVRCRLSIAAAATIKVNVGDMEVIKVKVVQSLAGGIKAAQVGEAVHITGPGSSGVNAGTPSAVEVEVPERYCDVVVDSGGGAVELAAVNEASVQISTHGGDIKVGRIKAAEAHLQADGGSLKAKQLVAQTVHVRASRVNVQQLMGRRVTVEQTASGAADKLILTAAYLQEDSTIDAGEAGMEIGTLSSEPGVARLEAGGTVRVDSLDGRARICGGSVAVHAQDNLKMLDVASRGDVSLRLSPRLAETLCCSFTPESAQPPQLPPGVRIRPADDLERQRGGADPPPMIKVWVVEGGGSRVEIAVESWIEALSRRTRGVGNRR